MTVDESTIPDTPWIEYYDEKKGKPYYYQKETKKTQWTAPPDYTQWKDQRMKELLKPTIWRKCSLADGRTYYADEDAEKMKTVGDVISYIKSKKGNA